MTRRTQSQWQALFDEHHTSGLTATAFCRERGLNPKYFSLRRKQLQDKVSEAITPAFVPVTVGSRHDTPMIKLRHGSSFSLQLPLSVSPTWLAQLIQQLTVQA